MFFPVWFNYLWSFLVFFVMLLFSISFFSCLYFYSHTCSLSLYVNIFSGNLVDLDLSLLIDFKSFLFSCIVLLITFYVLCFSYYYVNSSRLSNFFYFLMLIFVVSILIFINSSDFLIIILGWDGLGITSFFLVIFYQSVSSIYSGLITVLTNRLGDGIIICCILAFFLNLPSSLYFHESAINLDPSVSLVFMSLLIIASFTKSAIFPFSSWLPAAIAAPTPISALVHSSTLVTAGVYLLIRTYPLFSSLPYLYLFLTLSLFTSFYSGFAAFFEQDLKNVVALSTLSHLGFIITSLFLGCVNLSFLHLVSHALFNSLLFISVGGIIHTTHHSQDSRYLTCVFLTTPQSSLCFNFSLFNLLALPFFSGFYSNDLILESSLYSGFISGISSLLIYLNITLSVLYSIKLMLACSSTLSGSVFVGVEPSTIHFSLVIPTLGFSSIVGVTSLLWFMAFDSCLILPFFLNVGPTFILLIVIIVSFFFIFILNNYSVNSFYGSSMLYLSPTSSSLMSFLYFSFSNLAFKSFESGFLDSTNVILPGFLNNTSPIFKFLVSIPPVSLTLYGVLLLLPVLAMTTL